MTGIALDGVFGQPGGRVLEALLAATWKGALVVLMVLAVQALLGRRLPPRWRYALWLLAAVRLLMPVGPPSPLSLFRTGAGATGSPLPGLGLPTLAAGDAAPAEPAGLALGLAALLVAAWLLGLATIAARRAVFRRSLHGLLSGSRELGGELTAAMLLDRCRSTIGVRRRIRLLESPALTAPALWPGGFRAAPAILLPAGRWRTWTEEELRYVLLHELAHLRQGDGVARRLESVLTALHWFNPIVWLAARRARADREPACDALVLSHLDAAERAGYGRALIRAAEGARSQLPLPGLVGMADHRNQLRRRISMIAHPQPRSLRRAFALAAVGALLAVASWTDAGALARPAGDPAPPDAGDDQRQALTVQRTREVGVAMFSWLTDVVASGTGTSAAETAAAEDEPDPERFDWSRCPAKSYEELAAVLVPAYLAELPRTDGWGHPFEYCLNQQRPGDPRYVVGIRSPGRDGRWEDEVYPVGSFAPDAVDRDLVWIDGYFITWPEAPPGR